MTLSDSAHSIGFFLEGAHIPSSRFRVCQYQQLLSEENISYANYYTRPTKYLYYPDLIRNTPAQPLWAAGCLSWVIAQRLRQILLYTHAHSTIVLQRDLLYRISTPFLERLLFRMVRGGTRRRIVFDIDDAIFLGKGGVPSTQLENKIRYISNNCDAIIAGNHYLAEAIDQPAKTIVIPTVIPTERYQPKEDQANRDTMPVIGWTGVATNLNYLTELEEVLRSLAEKHQFAVHIVCEEGTPSPFSNPNFAVQMIGWNPESETSALRNFDVGLMPLRDDPWSQGKCGFKLLQYMATGVAAVASPVGVNPEIIKEGENGYLANSPEQWFAALDTLLSSPEQRYSLGRAGVATVQSGYSRKHWYAQWRNTLLGSSA